jgi:hypothetical protein
MADTRTCGPGPIADSLRDRADNLEHWRTLVLADLVQLQRILYEIEQTILNKWRTLPGVLAELAQLQRILYSFSIMADYIGQQQWTNLFIFFMLYRAFYT